MSTIQKLRSLELYLAAHPDCEENSECADRLSDVQELLNELPYIEADLKKENEEMKSMLEEIKSKYLDKIESAKDLKQKGTGAFSSVPSNSDIERLDVRIYERKTFVTEIEELLNKVK